MSSYCSCGVSIQSTARESYFELIRTSTTWAPDVWEPRLKALSALFPSADEMLGFDSSLLSVVSAWLDKAVSELLDPSKGTSVDVQERERSVDVLNKSLLDWLVKVESSGRLTKEDILTMFDFYHSLVERAIQQTRDSSILTESVPLTPRDVDASVSSTPVRQHRKQASSASLMTSTPVTVQNRIPQHIPSQHVTLAYLRFLEARSASLPPSYLFKLLPLLFRILASYMTPLPVVSVPTEIGKPLNQQQDIERKTVEIITFLLNGTFSTTCLIILKRHLGPAQSIKDDTALVKTSLGAHRTLRLQIRQVLGDRLAKLHITRQASASANHAGAPGQILGDKYLLERAERAWKDTNLVWDARRVSYLLVQAIKSWLAWKPSESDTNSSYVKRERVFGEVAALLKDVLYELDERNLESWDREPDPDDTPSAVGETLIELVKVLKTMTWVSL